MAGLMLESSTKSGEEDMKEEEGIIMEHILMVGSTGVGKSSHIRLMTGRNDIAISSGSASCTTKMDIYSDGRGRWYIDTVGAEDSRNLSDIELLNETHRELYKRNVKRIKVIWILNPNQRETSTIQKQARFIGLIDKLIWKSVMIAIKNPGYNLQEAAKGALAAIKSSTTVPVIGYTNIDWATDVPSAISALEPQVRNAIGFYNSNEIKTQITNILNNLPACEIKFQIKKCKKCGMKGDHRFSDDIPCHLLPIKVHPKNAKNERVHNGRIIKTHASGYTLEYFHPTFLLIHPDEKKKPYHDRNLYHEWNHSSSISYGHATDEIIRQVAGVEKYHSSSTIEESACPRCDNTKTYRYTYYWAESWVSTWYCRKCGGDIKAPCNFYHCWNCCDNSNHDGGGYVLKCSGMFHKSCGDTVRSVCSSCRESSTSTGCRERTLYNEFHKCCGQARGTTGCVQKCNSCGNSTDTEGCIKKSLYLCCDLPEDSEGCREKWECCNTDVLSTPTGCRLACCKTIPGETKGCKQRYSCCQRIVTKEKDNNECINKWNCCNNLEDQMGCKLKWNCCKAVVELNDPNNETKACQTVCKACEQIWGASTGCNAQAKHQFE